MKHKAYKFVSMIAFAMSSPVFAADPVTVGAAEPITTKLEQPRYNQTIIPDERVGVKQGTPKTIIFAVHANTADVGVGFVVDFPYVPNEPAYASVTATAQNQSGGALTAPACNTPSNTAGTCTFPMGTRIAKITFVTPINKTYSYRTYSTTYFQACDNSATRYCGTDYSYGPYSATFTSSTETQAGTVYQGDVDVFNNTFPVNTPRAGDRVILRVSSDKALINTIPSLRVKADIGTVENQIGHRYPCTPAIGDTSNKVWDCKIDLTSDAVPNLTGYANPRLVFSSTRGSALATIMISGITRYKDGF
jgi:hypothetical protein